LPTPRCRGIVRVTPDLAQQASVLPNCQRQHDRKESCSKHVILATPKGKSRASLKKGRRQEILAFSRGSQRPGRGTWGISRVGAENPAAVRSPRVRGRYDPDRRPCGGRVHYPQTGGARAALLEPLPDERAARKANDGRNICPIDEPIVSGRHGAWRRPSGRRALGKAEHRSLAVTLDPAQNRTT
jgi:hypothetical protein